MSLQFSDAAAHVHPLVTSTTSAPSRTISSGVSGRTPTRRTATGSQRNVGSSLNRSSTGRPSRRRGQQLHHHPRIRFGTGAITKCRRCPSAPRPPVATTDSTAGPFTLSVRPSASWTLRRSTYTDCAVRETRHAKPVPTLKSCGGIPLRVSCVTPCNSQTYPESCRSRRPRQCARSCADYAPRAR